MKTIYLAGVISLFTCIIHAESNSFPFVIRADDSSPSVTDMSMLGNGPAGSNGFVHIEDGQFFTDAGRLRFWGVNTCFAANYPTHDDATKVAAHLGKLGVNGIRIHHHDTTTAPRGLWGEVVDGRRQFDPEQIDKLDYFLNQLNKNGIYANLNLHVSRTFTAAEGFQDRGLKHRTRYNKYVLYYDPQMRERFKDYCRDYLLHKNPYRGLRRVDDPAIAMIEITNENGFSKWGPEVVKTLPDSYREEFLRQWNVWLCKKYGTRDKLEQAWRPASEPLETTLVEHSFTNSLGPWVLGQYKAGSIVPMFNQEGPEKGSPALLLKSVEFDGVRYHQELQFNNISLVKGALYTLSYWVKADAKRPMSADVSYQGIPNFQHVGYQETFNVGTEWQHVVRVFKANETIQNGARVCFKIGDYSASLHFADIRLQRGGTLRGLRVEEDPQSGTVPLVGADWSETSLNDIMQFMEETELGFINEIVDFLKNDLGVKVPITCSQIGYQSAEMIAATCDYADVHTYWNHPKFPGKPWDPGNWFVPNRSMVRLPKNSSLLNKASSRIIGMPFTVSEWNAPAPQDTAASCIPFAAMISGLQDWDGIFFFQYNSNQDWFGDKIRNFFSLNAHPTKLALLTAFAPCYRRGDLDALDNLVVGSSSERVSSMLAISHRTGMTTNDVDSSGVVAPTELLLSSPNESVVWDARDSERAQVRLNSPATRAVWGFVANQTFELGGLKLSVGPTPGNYAVIVMTSLDGLPLEESKRMLLTAIGRAENTGMGWNDDRSSVGRAWGEGPTLCDGIPIKISFEHKKLSVHALDPQGHRTMTVPVEETGDTSNWSVGPEYRTLWYEVQTYIK